LRETLTTPNCDHSIIENDQALVGHVAHRIPRPFAADAAVLDAAVGQLIGAPRRRAVDDDGEGPRYLAFVEALEEDIKNGSLRPGTRLLPQRDMAVRLGLSVGTVSRAYTEAEARGLISGEVGRGTFVRRPRSRKR
jgi:hypothetical protein